jgi:4-hydroxymandelate oxidase
MSSRFDPAITRRRFVQFLTGSPLLTHPGVPVLAQSTSTPARLADPMVWAPRDLDKLISDPEALDVFDFKLVARKNVPPAHFGYMVTGIDDEVTLRANREGFLKFQLRPRRLVDVSMIDMTVEIFGAKYDNPIVIAPTGSNRAFHPDGEVAVANAARVGNHLQILSSGATTSIEDAIAARGAPVWFQVYAWKWEVTESSPPHQRVSRLLGSTACPEDAASRGQGEREDGGREGSQSGIIPEQTGRLHQFH